MGNKKTKVKTQTDLEDSNLGLFQLTIESEMEKKGSCCLWLWFGSSNLLLPELGLFMKVNKLLSP